MDSIYEETWRAVPRKSAMSVIALVGNHLRVSHVRMAENSQSDKGNQPHLTVLEANRLLTCYEPEMHVERLVIPRSPTVTASESTASSDLKVFQQKRTICL